MNATLPVVLAVALLSAAIATMPADAAPQILADRAGRRDDVTAVDAAVDDVVFLLLVGVPSAEREFPAIRESERA